MTQKEKYSSPPVFISSFTKWSIIWIASKMKFNQEGVTFKNKLKMDKQQYQCSATFYNMSHLHYSISLQQKHLMVDVQDQFIIGY